MIYFFEDKKRNAKRFSYQGLKEKSNPWNKFESGQENVQISRFSEKPMTPKFITSNGLSV